MSRHYPPDGCRPKQTRGPGTLLKVAIIICVAVAVVLLLEGLLVALEPPVFVQEPR